MLKHLRLAAVGLLVSSMTGCMTGPTMFERHDEYSANEPGSDAWWAEKAQIAPGVKRRYWKGKVWPARPRPDGDRQQFTHTFHDAHYWPLPYVCQDRQYVEAVMAQQVAAGWQEQTTLYNRHFDPNSNQLNPAGRWALEQILFVVPEERRLIFVQTARDAEFNNVRLASVQNVATEMMVGGIVPPIEIRSTIELGRPATEVQLLREMELGSLPTPRISGGATGAGGVSGP